MTYVTDRERDKGIEFIGVPSEEKDKKEIWELLMACDQDFVPPLSKRTSSAQKMWGVDTDFSKSQGPKAYFEEMIRQQFVILKEKEKIIGFVTFKIKDMSVEVPGNLAANYITTLCIDPAHRGKHLAEHLYVFLEKELPDEVRASCLTLRTWSTNKVQLHILKKMGYVCCNVLRDDRGQGVDTLYFYKILDRITTHSQLENSNNSNKTTTIPINGILSENN